MNAEWRIRPGGCAVVERSFEVRRRHEDVARYLVHREDVVIVVVFVDDDEWLNVEDVGRRAAWPAAGAARLPSTGVGLAGATSQDELVGQVEPGVVLDRQIVGAVPAPRPIHRRAAVAVAPHRPVDLGRLEQRPVVVGGRARRQLNEEEQLVEDVETTTTDVTACVVSHVTKYRLNCVAICVAFNIASRKNSLSVSKYMYVVTISAYQTYIQQLKMLNKNNCLVVH